MITVAVVASAGVTASLASFSLPLGNLPDLTSTAPDCYFCFGEPVLAHCSATSSFAVDGCVSGDEAYLVSIEDSGPDIFLGELGFLLTDAACPGGVGGMGSRAPTPVIGALTVVAPYGSTLAPYGEILAQSPGFVNLWNGSSLTAFSPPASAASPVLTIDSLVIVFAGPASKLDGLAMCVGNVEKIGWGVILFPAAA